MRERGRSIPTLTAAALFAAILALAPLRASQSSNPPDAAAEGTAILLPARMIQQVRIRLPRDFDPERSYPLLVMLHGNGGNAAGLHSLLAAYANQPVIQAFPEGSYPAVVRGGLGFSWYYLTRDRKVWETADAFSVENVVEAIQALGRRFKVGKAYVFGFSQGASLAYMVGFKNAALMGGIAAVGGRLPEIGSEGSVLSEQDLAGAKAVPVFLARGNADELAKKPDFEKQKDYLASRGFHVTVLEYEGAHTLTMALLDRLFRWILTETR